MTEANYHHSVRHYHSPFPLGHRNARAFPSSKSQQGPWSATADEQQRADDRYRTAAETNDYSVFLDTPSSPGGTGSSRRVAGGNAAGGGATTPRGGSSPSRRRRVDLPYESDHMYLSRMEPQANSPYHHHGGGGGGGNASSQNESSNMAAIPPGTSFLKTNPLAHGEGHVGLNDSNAIWNDHKHLRFGVHRRKKAPYVTPDEFVDPLRCTTPGKLVPCGYTRREITHKRKFPGTHVEVAVGYKRAPMCAQELPQKINWHNPFKPQQEEEADLRMLKRLPVTPLLEEVEERLRSQGFGSIVDVRFASDDAIAELLQACGFAPTQRMTILWELRRRYPLPPQHMLQQ